MERLRSVGREVLLFFMGGMGYFCLELIWRGWSHWTMALVGGLCFLGVGRTAAHLEGNAPMAWQALIGAAIITAVEFVSGCVLNLWLGLGIWDYSSLPGSVLGQICLPYTALWCLLAFPVILADDYLRWCLRGGTEAWHCPFKRLQP